MTMIDGRDVVLKDYSSRGRKRMKRKSNVAVKGEAKSATRNFEPKETVYGSMIVTKEDLYRIIFGVAILVDNLIRADLITVKERGMEIKDFATKPR